MIVTGMSSINDLPFELVSLILQKVDLDSIKKCCLTTKKWLNIIKSANYMISLCNEKFVNYPKIGYRSITEEDINFGKTLITSKNELINLDLLLYDFSSYDNIFQHPLLSISKHPHVFWSSIGTDEPSDEYITYGINSSIGVISEVHIKFYEAFYLGRIENGEGFPCFSSRTIKLEIFNERQNKIFSSPEYLVKQNNSSQVLKFNPVFVTKDCRIRLNLIGKIEKQISDLKYYTCVNSFEIYGIPDLPFRYKDDIFTKIPEKELFELYREFDKAKMQLYYLSDKIYRNQNSILILSRQQKESILGYFNLLGQGKSLTPT